MLAVVEWILFCCLVCGERPAALSGKRGIGWGIAAVLMICRYMYDWPFLSPLLMLVVTFSFFSFRMGEGIRVWLVVYLFLSILELGVGYFLKGLLRYPYWKWEKYLSEAILMVFFIIYYKIIPSRNLKKIGQFPLRIWGLIVSFLLAMLIMLLHLLNIYFKIKSNRAVRVGSVAVVVGIAAISVMILICIHYYNTAQVYRIQNEYEKQQQEYFIRLLEREQDTRQFRHDIANHLISIQGFAERKEFERLDSYVNDLLQEIHAISGRQYDVGNHMINTLINYYFLPIQNECEIHVDGYIGDTEFISGPDLCVLVSNLVKNAVEAVEYVDAGAKRIVFEVSLGKHFFHIRIENTIKQTVLTGQSGLPKTFKKDRKNHGIGLLNVREVVEKYDGTFDYHIENNVFIAEAYIKIE